MKLHFSDGYMFYLQQEEEGEGDGTPTLMGHAVPAPSDKRTISTDDFDAMDASSEEGQAAVQALSE